jgi:hypothetical protein
MVRRKIPHAASKGGFDLLGDSSKFSGLALFICCDRGPEVRCDIFDQNVSVVGKEFAAFLNREPG